MNQEPITQSPFTRDRGQRTRTLGPRTSLFRSVSAVVLVALTLFTLEAAAPPAGSVIGNQASATYTDSSNVPRTATSNVALTTVAQVAGLSLTADNTRTVSPGGQVVFPHTLVNTGNGTDTFNLTTANLAGTFDWTSIAIYADANGDGVPDNSTVITTSGPLAAGGTFKFVVVAVVPASATASQTDQLTVTATSVFNGTATALNTDAANVSVNAVVALTKSISVPTGLAGTGPYTYTLTFQNTGNSAASNLDITDTIPAGMTYVAGSGRWSGSATALTDAAGGDPAGITYQFGVTPLTVEARVTSLAPGQSGTLTFQVNVNSGLAPQNIDNSATFSYNDGAGVVPVTTSNAARFTVQQTAGVTLGDSTIASATQGGTVTFTNLLTNTGNATDTFNITFTTPNSFPAGTTFTIYQADSNTPMVDSNGDNIPDTGPVATNATYNVVIKATLPTGVSGGGAFVATKRATSVFDPTVFDPGTDTLTTIASNSVDLQNSGGTGSGAGPEGTPVTTNPTNPGTTTRFTLLVNNTTGGTGGDTYSLAASTNSTFGTIGLPTGWTVTFRNTAEAVITGTGVITNAGSMTVYADVFVPTGTAPGTNSIYFRALSPTSLAVDIKHDAVAVNTVRSLSLTPNQNGQIYPGGTVVYSHTLVNNGNVLEGDNLVSTIALSKIDSQTGWSSVVYYDLNGNGTVDPTDPVVTDTSFVSNAGAGLAPGETVRLLVKVFAPAGVPVGTVDITTLTATTSNGTYTTTVPTAVNATDTTTVISGDLVLTKEQAIDSNCDGTADTAYSVSPIASAAPGACVRYRITVVNSGTAPALAVIVYDSTPTYTVYTEGSVSNPAATTVGTVDVVPAEGAAGTLKFNIGTLNPGESAVITFGVKIQQ